VDVDRETIYASWNRGIQLASAPVLGFWNVDDRRFLPAMVEAVTGIHSGAKLVYFPHVVDRRWREWGWVPQRHLLLIPAPDFHIELAKRTFLPGPFFMFSRGLYEEVGPFDEQFSICGDRDWGLRALRHTPLTPGSQVAGVFLNEERGLSMSGSARAVAENNAIYMRHGLTDLLEPVDGSLVAEYDIGRIRVGSAWRAFPDPSSAAREVLVHRSAEPAQQSVSAALGPKDAAESLLAFASSGVVDRRFSRLAAVSARHYLATVARKELEARLCCGDIRHARREFLRTRPAYLSTARFVVALPVVMASPRLYAAYLRCT
jgi:hypothetical protein